MGQMIALGAGLNAYLALPSGYTDGGAGEAGGIRGALIVVHEVWGLVAHTKDVADRFAAEGYLVIAPDLLAKDGPDPELAAELEEKLSDPQARSQIQPKLREAMAPLRAPGFAEKTLANMRASFDYLTRIPAVAGRIGVTGFCFGGTYAFSLAVHEPRLRAAVPFYGHADFDVEQLHRISCPVLTFYGDKDEALVSKLPELKDSMREAGVDFTAVVYPGAGHAFFNDTNGRTYREDAAADSWRKSLDFLAANLG
ncbi:MAG: dienelactone hydrolase family protein [Actinomycetota bacterium]|nr:dienelactone hydrolase family protein [Actinomycetota bacterium]